ncbi:MAG: hypothetical protein HY720_25210 [Planctomycetes bacterium]|nr:hypothetical protein [Planctomycetota bacterium]
MVRISRVLWALGIAARLALPVVAQDGEDWSERKRVLRELLDRELSAPETKEAAPADRAAGEEPIVETAAREIDLRDVVVALFEAYEREDAGGFVAHVHPGFSARDDSGNDYRRADLPRALADDFEVLERIRFSVFVGQTILQQDGMRAEAEVRWTRLAMTQVGAREWILLDQRSVFQFDRSGDGESFLLSRIFGDTIFALANPRGQVVASEGTLDGERIAEPLVFDRFLGVVEPEQPAASEPAPAAAGSTVVTGSFSTQRGYLDFDAQNFPLVCAFYLAADNDFRCFALNTIWGCNGATIRDISGMFANLDAVDAVPAPPYPASVGLNQNATDVGRLFAVRTNIGFFAAYEITGFDPASPPGTYTIRFKYQPNGTRNMK